MGAVREIHICIFQIELIEDFYDVSFEPYNIHIELRGQINPAIYDCVYQTTKTVSPADSEYEILEELFEEFNMNRPSDFDGHSMSVSDVVTVDGIAYFCDSIGWKELGAWM